MGWAFASRFVAAFRNFRFALIQSAAWGGLAFSMKGEDVAQALISFAREYGITHIVLGRPGPRKLRRLFKTTLHEKLLEALPDVDLVVV
jgi:two-component system sensor histidine kinase KdpD